MRDYDLGLDMLGSDTLTQSFKVLKRGGTIVSSKGQDTDKVAPLYGVRFESFRMEPHGAMLGELGALIDAGAVTPVILFTVLVPDRADISCIGSSPGSHRADPRLAPAQILLQLLPTNCGQRARREST